MAQRRQYLGPLTDSRRWTHIRPRPDDIIVVTPPKSGTTWMQVIVALLLSGDPGVEPELAERMPWVDLRFREIADVARALEAMQHRRSMKSHTPLDGLPEGGGQIICVFRHPLDAHFSYRRHLANMKMPFFVHWYPEGDSESDSESAFGGVPFRRFLDGGAEGFDGDALALAHILRHYREAKARAGRGAAELFHYADMCRDLPGTFERVARLIGVSHPPEVMAQLVRVAGFDQMRAQASRFVPLKRGGTAEADRAFFDSGTSGKWEGRLSREELAAYDAVMEAELDAEDRRWLEYGGG